MMICPKCRQPLDGDEPYICCASATLQWRCEDCGKVSEGFAFPYGLCPLCSGKLARLDPRRIDDEDGLDAVRAAFEIELGGHAFYARAAQQADEPLLRRLFSKLEAMEREHMATLSRRYHTSAPEAGDHFRVDRAALYAGLENRPEDPGNLFRLAIAFEERAAAFFAEASNASPEGSPQRQLYKELAAEEREHIALLSTEYELWKTGRAGLL